MPTERKSSMENQAVTLLSRIDPETFRAFALFDAFRRQKRWRGPALFAAIFSAFAIVCFTLGRDLPQSGLLGGVLLAVGLGLPLFYVMYFLHSVETQAKKLRLAQKRPAYTVRLDETGLSVEQSGQKAAWPWEELTAVYRLEQCVCLYPTARNAFLLPDGEDSHREVERAWELVRAHMSGEKIFDLRK